MEKNKVQFPIQLSEGRIENFADFVNLAFEYVVFFKWIYFKNRPRANLLLVRSVLLTGTFFGLYFTVYGDFTLVLEGIDIDPALAFAGSVVLGFWHMTSSFYKKTDSANELYYRILECRADGEDYKAEVLCTAFAIRLVTLDMWAHRIYGDLFAETLLRAIDSNAGMDGSDPNLALDKLRKGQMQSKEARAQLQSYGRTLQAQKSVAKVAA